MVMYAVVFIRGNDRRLVGNDVIRLQQFIFKHCLHTPISYILNNAARALKDPQNPLSGSACNQRTLSCLMNCPDVQTWSILCVSQHIVDHLVRTKSMKDLFGGEGGKEEATAARMKERRRRGMGRKGREEDPREKEEEDIFWIRSFDSWLTAMGLEEEGGIQEKKSVYVPIFNQYPNPFTTYINNIRQENATVYHSIACITNNLNLLNSFFRTWVQLCTQPVFHKTRSDIRRLEMHDGGRGREGGRGGGISSGRNTTQLLTLFVDSYQSLIAEYAHTLYEVRESYDRAFLADSMVSLLTHGFSAYTFVDIGYGIGDDSCTAVKDLYDQNVYVSRDSFERLNRCKQLWLTKRKYSSLSLNLSKYLRGIVDERAANGGRPSYYDHVLKSYDDIFKNFYSLLMDKKWIVPLYIHPRVIVKNGLNCQSFAFDIDGNKLELIFGQENTTLDSWTLHSPYDIQSPLTVVLNKYLFTKDIVQCVGLSFSFESKPLVQAKYNQVVAESEREGGPRGTGGAGGEIRSRHETFGKTRMDEGTALLEFDNKLHHMYLDKETARKRCIKEYDKIARAKLKHFKEALGKRRSEALNEFKRRRAADSQKRGEAPLNNARLDEDDEEEDDEGGITEEACYRMLLDSAQKEMKNAESELERSFRLATQDYQLSTRDQTTSGKGVGGVGGGGGGGGEEEGEGSGLLNKALESRIHRIITNTHIDRSINNTTVQFLDFIIRHIPNPGLRGMSDRLHQIITLSRQTEKDNEAMVRNQLVEFNQEIVDILNGAKTIYGWDEKSKSDEHRPISRLDCPHCCLDRAISYQSKWQENPSCNGEYALTHFTNEHNLRRMNKMKALYPYMPTDAIVRALDRDPSYNLIEPPCCHHDYDYEIKSTPSLSRVNILKFIDNMNNDIVLAITGRQAVTNRQEIINSSGSSSSNNDRFDSSWNPSRLHFLPQTEEVVGRSIDLINYITKSVFGEPILLSSPDGGDLRTDDRPVNIYVTKVIQTPTLNASLTSQDISHWQSYVNPENLREYFGNYLNIDKRCINQEFAVKHQASVIDHQYMQHNILHDSAVLKRRKLDRQLDTVRTGSSWDLEEEEEEEREEEAEEEEDREAEAFGRRNIYRKKDDHHANLLKRTNRRRRRARPDNPDVAV